MATVQGKRHARRVLVLGVLGGSQVAIMTRGRPHPILKLLQRQMLNGDLDFGPELLLEVLVLTF